MPPQVYSRLRSLPRYPRSPQKAKKTWGDSPLGGCEPPWSKWVRLTKTTHVRVVWSTYVPLPARLDSRASPFSVSRAGTIIGYSSIYKAWNMVPNAIMGNASSARNRFDRCSPRTDRLPSPYPRPALLRGPCFEPKADRSVRGSTRCITFCKILTFWLGDVRVGSLPLLLSDLLYSFRAHQQCSFTQACTINTGTIWEG